MRKRRYGLGILSQGISSASNIGVALIAARYLPADQFGSFATAYLLCVLALGSARALVGEPLLVAAGAPDAREEALRSISLLGAASAAALVGASVFAAGELKGTLLAAGLVIWPVLVLDAERYHAFGTRRPGRAVVIDASWAATAVLGIALVLVSDSLRAWAFIAAWGAGAYLIVGCATRGLSVALNPTSSWVRRHWALSWRYLTEWSIGSGLTQLTLLLLAPIAGLAAVGAVRATQVLFGPVNVVFGGALAVLVPEGAHLESPRLLRVFVRSSALFAAAALGLTAALLALPTGVGRSLLGDTWGEARPLLLPAGLVATAGGAMAGAFAGLRSLRAASSSLGVRVRTAPLVVVVPLAGAWWHDEVGYLWGSVVATALAAALWWRSLIAELSTVGSVPARSAPRADDP